MQNTRNTVSLYDCNRNNSAYTMSIPNAAPGCQYALFNFGQQSNGLGSNNLPNLSAPSPSHADSHNLKVMVTSVVGHSAMTDSSVPNVASSCMASFLAGSSKPRAESFMLDEVKALLEEIAQRKHILLSLSPSTNRLKRRAWEEVASNMADRWPHSPRRTADQVKKKWENLVSKTKRKLRAGHITPDLEWSEANSIVMEFLAQHSPLLQTRYAQARSMLQDSCRSFPFGMPAAKVSETGQMCTRPWGSSTSDSVCMSARDNVSCSDARMFGDGDVKPSLSQFGETSQEPMCTMGDGGEPTAMSSKLGESGTDEHCASTSVCNSFGGSIGLNLDSPLRGSISQLPGFSSDRFHQLVPGGLTSLILPKTMMNQPTLEPLENGGCDPNIQRLIVQQTEEEFSIRLDILRLQKKAWELQVALLEQAVKAEKHSAATDKSPTVELPPTRIADVSDGRLDMFCASANLPKSDV